MKNLLTLLMLVLFACSSSVARAEVKAEYDFMVPYIARMEKLKHLPEKKIKPTLYCSNMRRFVDEARMTPKTRIGLKADRIVVSKSRRKLYLFNEKELISEYSVTFGFAALEGPKSQMSDGRTPEGLYQIQAKNPHSNYHKALQVSYPDEGDKQFAAKYKVNPGGLIMIHGYPRKEIDGLDPVLIPQLHPKVNWTQGCIAVTNSEIEEVYELVEEQVAIEICPLENMPNLSANPDLLLGGL